MKSTGRSESAPLWSITLVDNVIKIHDSVTGRAFVIPVNEPFSNLHRNYLLMKKELLNTSQVLNVIVCWCYKYITGNKNIFRYLHTIEKSRIASGEGKWEDTSVKTFEGFIELYTRIIPKRAYNGEVDVRIDPKTARPIVYYRYNTSSCAEIDITRSEAYKLVGLIRQTTALHGITEYNKHICNYKAFNAYVAPDYLYIDSKRALEDDHERSPHVSIRIEMYGSRERYRRQIARFCDQLMAAYNAPITGMVLRRIKHRGKKLPRDIVTAIMRCMMRLPIEFPATP